MSVNHSPVLLDAAGPDTGAEYALATYSLASLIRDGVPPPELLGDLLYRSAVHVIAGEPDSGKTSIALWVALGLLRSGSTVLMVDEEGGAEMTAEKLISLGATEADAARLHYAPFPARRWTAADVAGLGYTMTHVRPDLVLADSAAALLARAGLDESSAPDVTGFWSRVLVPLAREHGAAVLVIDHDSKGGAASRYSRGSGAKLAASDVMIKVEMVQPFSRTQNGVLRLAVTKDRRGWLHRHWEVGVTTGNGVRLVFTRTSGETDPEPAQLPPAAAKIAAVLTADPATIATITDRIVAAYGHGLKRETVSRCLNDLARRGLADKLETGKGKADFWSIAAGQTCDITGVENEGV